jgi:NADH-quinone oxidoreductase subunit L
MPPSIEFLWLIPALPLLAAAIGAITPRRRRTDASNAALAAMAAAFALSCLALRDALSCPADTRLTDNFLWLGAGTLEIHFGVLLDPFAAFMVTMVTFVGFLIFLFSTAYMREDENYAKFFCYLSLFAAAMLGMLVSNSLLFVFVCWELVGLASYLLIGFWFHKPAAAAAAKKAFITTRVGDIGFLLGLLWLHSATGTQLFYNDGAGCLEPTALANLSSVLPCGLALSSAIGLLLFAGAAGKSGQFPLHVWLPDAMEGPTPVSALIHAATMVAAGVFLMARVFPLLVSDKDGVALAVIAFTGALTALLGALMAVAQNDIKRVLAFSTVSQLGYMMLSVGVGCPQAAVFHLLAHAFFKALLFLGAGSVIHAAHHEQDMRRMGGLAPRMKITFAAFAAGMMALSGIPFFFSGFWSKEAVLHGALHWSVSLLPFCAALAAVVLTAFYMTRLMANVFAGPARSHAAEHARENNRAMTFPLLALAVCAVAFGFLGTPAWPWLQSKMPWPDTAAPAEPPAFDPSKIFEGMGLTAASIALVALGIGAGWALYGRRPRADADAADPLEKASPALWRVLEHRLYFDEIYAATLVKAHYALAAFADALDRRVLGGCVRLAGKLGETLGLVNKNIAEAGLNAGFNTGAESLRRAGTAYSRTQTGDIRSYLSAFTLAFVVLACAVFCVFVLL